jgi:hypothetical protein
MPMPKSRKSRGSDACACLLGFIAIRVQAGDDKSSRPKPRIPQVKRHPSPNLVTMQDVYKEVKELMLANDDTQQKSLLLK